jgi:uncharacterized protein YicC (UPF0701 family)
MEDAITMRQNIEKKIEQLEKERLRLFKAAQVKAKRIAEYDKAISLTMLKLKNGVITEFEGQSIDNITATTVEKIARGICWKESLNKEEGESLYKSLLTNIDCIRAELNGLQSVNKFFE